MQPRWRASATHGDKPAVPRVGGRAANGRLSRVPSSPKNYLGASD